MPGWVGLVAGIAGYDVFQVCRGHETMSQCWARWLSHRVGRRACIVIWTGTTVHLFWALKERS